MKEEVEVDNDIPGSSSSQTSTTTPRSAVKRRRGATTSSYGSSSEVYSGQTSSESVPSHSRATVLQYRESRPSTSSGSQGNIPRW